MKKFKVFLLLIFLMSATTTITAQNYPWPWPILDTYYFDSSNPSQDLEYSGDLAATMNGVSRVEMVSVLPPTVRYYINGTHLEIMIPYESLMRYFFHSNPNNYYDIEVMIYNTYGVPAPNTAAFRIVKL